jgi:predicted nuclease with TOPRIM domain
MSTVTDNDLRELKDLINSKFQQIDSQFLQINEKIDSKFERVFEELTTIKVDIATLKEGQNNTNQRITETKETLSKRLDNLDKIALTVVIGVIVALIIGLFKTLYPNLLG